MKVQKNYKYWWHLLYFGIRSIFKSTSGWKIKLDRILNYHGTSTYYKNGRSALYAALKRLKNEEFETVFLPYRICNILEMAALKAGMTVKFYRNKNDLQLLLAETMQPFVLVQVSSMGYSGYFEANEVKQITNISVPFSLIYDECQNLSTASLNSDRKLNEKDFLLYSFNDKTIPGIMGAVLLHSGYYNFQPEKLSAGRQWYFYMLFIKELITFATKPIVPGKYSGEYSKCISPRYRIDEEDISRLSASVAEGFLGKIREIETLRLQQFQVITERTANENKDLLPYVAVNNPDLFGNCVLKGPYLKEAEEDVNSALLDDGIIGVVNSYKYLLNGF